MRFGSICSGIEAASVAWHPLGWRAAWLAEIEPFPCSLLAHHYPSVTNYGDMTALPDRIRAKEIEAPDVLCGGTPCQAFSVAGLRRSLDDARGNLSLTFCEIANAIDIIRRDRGEPECIIVWENVPGVLSTDDNAFGCFLAGLAGESQPLQPAGKKWSNAGCVFGPERAVAWRIFDAQYFGVAQRRRRVFVVASARDGFDPCSVLFEPEGVRRDSAPSREAGEVAPTIPARSSGGGGLGADFDCDGGLIAFPANLSATQHASAENLAPSMGAKNPTAVAFAENSRAELRLEGGDGSRTGALTSGGGKAGQGMPMVEVQASQSGVRLNETVGTLDANYGSRRHNGVLEPVCVTGNITHTLKAAGFDGSEDGTGRGQPIVAQTYRDQMGLEHWLDTAVSVHGTQDPDIQNDQAHTLGCNSGQENAVLAFTTEQTPKFNLDCALTLTKQSPTGGGQIQSVMTAMRVRRLTPRECERLQGFPDDYTLVPHRGKPAADGPRYKALGNSWAVPVVRWLGSRIAEHITQNP